MPSSVKTCKLLEQKILSFHAHLLLSLRPSHYLPEVVDYLKGTASHEANHHHSFANSLDWLRGYHVDSVSEDNLHHARSHIKAQYTFHPKQIPQKASLKESSGKKRKRSWKLNEEHKPNDRTYGLYYHVVWSTAKRFPLIDEPMAQFLSQFFLRKCEKLEVRLLEQNILSEHVHLLLNQRPMHYIPEVMNGLKGASSYETNKSARFSATLSWPRGYRIQTVSQRDLHGVKLYIQNQYDHHPDKIPQPISAPVSASHEEEEEAPPYPSGIIINGRCWAFPPIPPAPSVYYNARRVRRCG